MSPTESGAGESYVLPVVAGLIVAAVIFVLDAGTAPEMSFAPLYAVPAGVLAWYGGPTIAIVVALLAIAGGLAFDLTAPAPHAPAAVLYWNAAVGFACSAAAAFLRVPLQRRLDRERASAGADPTTGTPTGVQFVKLANVEVMRARRYGRPVTLAQFGLDNFKALHDRLGRGESDLVLRCVAQTLTGNLRGTDIVGRVGNDDFAVLLPETGPEPARLVLRKLVDRLAGAMQIHGWPLTFSIGAATVTVAVGTIEEMTRLVDELATAARRRGKNIIQHEVLAGLDRIAP